MVRTSALGLVGRVCALVGITGLVAAGVIGLSQSGAGAVEYGNPNFLGILKASPPSGFPVSPAALDLSAGPATVKVSVAVVNLTGSARSVPIQFSVHRILTFKGVDVSDGQPGQPGITFPLGTPALTTQVLYGPRQTQTFAVPSGAATTSIAFSTSIAACGYYQIDLSTPTTPYVYLAAGFTRALGCASKATTTSTSTTSTSTTSTTVAQVLPTSVTAGPTTTTTVAQVLGVTTPTGQLPLTGSNSWVLLAVSGLLLLAGLGLVGASRSPRRSRENGISPGDLLR